MRTFFTLLACLSSIVYASSRHPKSSIREFYDRFVAVNNQFAVKLLQGARNSKNHTDNVFVSPYSVITGLGMLSVAAHGQTKEEILRVLNAQGMGNKHVASALGNLTTLPNYTLSVANKVWAQSSVAICKVFQRRMQKYYSTSLQQVDFQSNPEMSREMVNSWVENRTQGHIQELLPPDSVTHHTRLVLTNAVYFQATWNDNFNKSDTRRRPFSSCTDNGKESSNVHMMQRIGNYKYKLTHLLSVGDIEVLELPYSASNTSMFLVLPQRSACSAINKLGKLLTPDLIPQLTSDLVLQPINVSVPKFTLSDDTQVDTIFQTMGINRAFSASLAEMSGINCDKMSPLYVSKSFHQAMVVVNEQGTVSAAASAETHVNRIATPIFQVNRPFLFMIMDKVKKAVLFIGQVVKL